MSNPFQSLLDFLAKLGRQEDGRYPGRGAEVRSSVGEDSRPVFTALDIGTAYAKAIIIEIQDDVGVEYWGQDATSRAIAICRMASSPTYRV